MKKILVIFLAAFIMASLTPSTLIMYAQAPTDVETNVFELNEAQLNLFTEPPGTTYPKIFTVPRYCAKNYACPYAYNGIIQRNGRPFRTYLQWYYPGGGMAFYRGYIY